MKLLVDMNLPPRWVEFLGAHGVEAVHWSKVGDPGALDSAVMSWARDGGYVVLTSDLDFSAILAVTDAKGPSVLQVRARDVFPDAIGEQVVRVLSEQGEALQGGAIVSMDAVAGRVRVLPVGRGPAGPSPFEG